ncbi:fibronectin/fibrinogen-binding protein [Candidatus Woesearchaeota archaeon]|nr:fibronectin/fibrinogen-binding protein [Candidatus Woesearchaeota archaeon]
MKSDISSLELHFMVSELQSLLSAKLEQIYQVGKEEIILQFHVPSTGKRILRIMIGSLMYVATEKSGVPEKPPGFCIYLRRKLKNARLRKISQLGFERVVEFLFETKDMKFRLVFEMFSKGNVVLCDEAGMILSPLERQEWKSRSVRPGENYVSPSRDNDLLLIDRDSFVSAIIGSDKESVVKALAIDFGIGGVYSEEICIIAGVDKALKPVQLSDVECRGLFSAAKSILSCAMNPIIYYSDKEKSDVKDITPFPLKFYEGLSHDVFSSFSEALDTILTKKDEARAVEQAESSATNKIDKVHDMISKQEQRIEGLERSETENQRKGEIIYENYPLVQKAITEMAELGKELSWKEVGKMFKNHKVVHTVDPKTGEFALEL